LALKSYRKPGKSNNQKEYHTPCRNKGHVAAGVPSMNEINGIINGRYCLSRLFCPDKYLRITIMKPNAKAKAVANNIRRVREFRNYTQDYVARKIGISQNAYSKLELGLHKLSVERLFQIADVLDVDCAALLQHDGDGIVQLHADSAVRQATQ